MKPLSFVVIIPFCDPALPLTKDSKKDSPGRRRVVPKASAEGWQALKSSPYCVKHLRFKAQDHGYCEGSQHLRPTRYKTSRFDSSLFVLQNEAARRTWPVTSEVCSALREAFRSRFEEELQARRRQQAGLQQGEQLQARPPRQQPQPQQPQLQPQRRESPSAKPGKKKSQKMRKRKRDKAQAPGS